MVILNLGEVYIVIKITDPPHPTTNYHTNCCPALSLLLKTSPPWTVSFEDMAPKVAQTNGRGLVASRTIVPALPLAYLQKGKQQVMAREKESARRETKDKAVDAVVLNPSPLSPPNRTALSVEAVLPEVTPVIVNGSTGDRTSEDPAKTVERPQSVASAAPEIEEEVSTAASTVSEVASTKGETTGKQAIAFCLNFVLDLT